MAAKKKKAPARPPKDSLCDRMKGAAAQLAREYGFEITDLRCSMMSAMFVPGGKSEKRTAFSFTIMGKDKDK